ncbi:hypothetical protein P8Q88_04085 [Qipengyuania sp. XHP0207]|uniref:hypothetical protein n=1 Tax=Qipengyuania sp. XHP0207 TaxID=3038078 RepID=UPI0024200D57|nr:hypothetical protein [Qipengyuania sp. XHP0207]MDG5747350.1 hypothetical protein [Qipengyuania sp. XHP0207]
MQKAAHHSRPKIGRFFGFAQVAIAVGAVGGLLLAPPAYGQLAFYPISSSADRELPRVIFQDDRRLVARTYFADGYVMQGARPPLFELLFEHGILVLAVPESGCTGATIGK